MYIILCVVFFIFVLFFLSNSTSLPDNTPPPNVNKYILLTVNSVTNQPTHIVLLHTNQHALCKDLTRPKSNWKLCIYTWNSHTRHLRYHFAEAPQQPHQPHNTTHTIRFQPLQQKHPTSPPAYIAYQPKHTSYLWKPTPNAFRCSALMGQTLSIQPNNQSSHPLPFETVQIHSHKRARVRLPTNQRWVDCRFTCRKMSGGAARRFDAVLYIKPAQQNHNRDHDHKHNHTHKHHNNVPFQTAVLRWRGGRVVRVEWLDGRGVRWVEACGGK